MKPVSTTSVASDDLIYCLWLGRKKKRETITWLTEEKQTRIKRGCCFCFCSFCCCCLWGNWARWSMPAPVAKSADGHQFFFFGGGANPIMSFLRRSFYFCLGFLCGVSSFSFSFLFLLMFLVGGGGVNPFPFWFDRVVFFSGRGWILLDGFWLLSCPYFLSTSANWKPEKCRDCFPHTAPLSFFVEIVKKKTNKTKWLRGAGVGVAGVGVAGGGGRATWGSSWHPTTRFWAFPGRIHRHGGARVVAGALNEENPCREVVLNKKNSWFSWI